MHNMYMYEVLPSCIVNVGLVGINRNTVITQVGVG